MAYNPNRALVSEIIRQVPGPLRALTLATALQESGGRLNAVGDRGHSFGPFQEYDQGRGAGLSVAQREDPAGAVNRFYRELLAFQGRGFQGPELAYRTQRPADHAGYVAGISRLLPIAQQLLGGASAAHAAAGAQVAPTGGGGPAPLPPELVRRLAQWQTDSQEAALAGDVLPLPAGALEALRAAKAARANTTPAPAAAPQAGPVATFGDLLMPLSTPLGPRSEFNVADGPEGVPTGRGGFIHGGKDWFAPPGSAIVAPTGGRIVEVKASRGTSGQVFGGVVKLQDPSGRVFVFRHVDPRGVRVGQAVNPGVELATVSPWKGGSTHAHIEVWRSLAGGYNAGNLLDPERVFGG